MGCCASTSGKAPFSAPPPQASPHPLLEEESVKEVLSETPAPKLKIPKIDGDPTRISPIKPKPCVGNSDDFSEASEICSNFSESVSMTTVNENRDDDGDVRDKQASRSPAKFYNRSLSGDSKTKRMAGKSPARISEPSPGRVRSIRGREKRGLLVGRDSGECSGRRSRSPANRRDGAGTRSDLGRSPSARKLGKSPGRVRSDISEMDPKFEESNRESKWPPTTNESLENPLVSLECFIFL